VMCDTDVFVVGGGPAGLAAALAARRKGLRVMVADSARPPIDKACGEGLMPDGLDALRSLGVEISASSSFPFRGIRFVDSGSAAEADFPRGVGLGIRRTTLHQAMTDRATADGVTLLWGAPVSGVVDDGVVLDGRTIRSRWIVGADGGNSRVRRWARLDVFSRESLRFGFRRHYRIAPWTDFVEIHWGPSRQIYVTPVGPEEVCVALISRESGLRLDEAIRSFPVLASRLGGAARISDERGAVSATRRLRAICRGRVALIGDASGSVDAITGEGLCLSFRQAIALADSLETGDLAVYSAEHRRMSRRPSFMAELMLTLENRTRLRKRAIRALSSEPRVFSGMLALHVGEARTADLLASGLSLAWRMLTLGAL
jgi:2-polyprenyl-6-methoxyphenol hydroxylase-like FAD-dependent oxidoreductase